jgi:predicted nucleic-acid-binding protein
MIGFDTNVLVRYFAQDDPVQSARATQIIERGLTERRPDALIGGLGAWADCTSTLAFDHKAIRLKEFRLA